MARCKAGWPLLAAIAIALALAACGSGDEEATTSTPTGTVAVTGTASPPRTSTPAISASTTPGAGPAAAKVIDLATSPAALTIYAADKGDMLNDVPSMAIGDFNGDGIDDLLLGARFGDGPDNSREDAGEAYVIFGRKDLPKTIDIAKAEQDMTIYGAVTNDNLGYGVAALDINDDGVDDIVVSSPLSEGPEIDFRTDRGEVYVIYGGKQLPKTVDIANGEQNATVIGAEGFALTGDSMTAADVNGDGIDDLIIGAPFAGRDPGTPPGGHRTELGETYVVFGSKNLKSVIRTGERQEDFTVVGPEQYSELGDAVAAGDVNGDGIDDLILTGEAADWPDRPNVGIDFAVFGSKDLSGLRELAKSEADVTIVGRRHDDALGFCVTSGDVNGDGIDDVLAVAQRADGLATRQTSGEADVVLGSRQLKGTIDVLNGEQDITIPGAQPHDLLSSCDAGHDVNGDGIDDILLGTGFTGPDLSRDGAGEAYVIFGRKNLSGTVDLARDADVLIIGAEAGDRLGSAITAGDINGDGKAELLLAAPSAGGPDNTRPEAGEWYVVTSPR